MKVLIAPSMLALCGGKAIEKLDEIENSSCEWIHVDCMDGIFVSQRAYSACDVKLMRGVTKKVLDVHLMVANPLMIIDDYIAAGSDLISFHIEAARSENEALKIIRYVQNKGIKCGIALNPETPIKAVENLIDDVDYVLVMAVTPGLGGQKFNNNVLGKVKLLVKLRLQLGADFKIQIDGGIDDVTAKLARAAGCDVLVSGTFLLSSGNFEVGVTKLRGE